MSQSRPDLLTRRTFFPILGAAAFGVQKAFSAQALHYLNLDHVSVQTSDIAKGLDFYSHLFGAVLRKENDSARSYVKIGSAYLAVSQGRGAFRPDHFCAGLHGTTIDEAKAELKNLGIAFTEPPPFGLFFPDPEGIRVQMWSEYSWTDVGRTTSPIAAASVDAVFQPNGLDRLELAVGDLDKAAVYYEKLFGPVAARDAKTRTVWFQVGTSRLGLKPVMGEQKPSIDRFCVSVAPFNAAAAARRLAELGAKVEGADSSGELSFSDPDGIRLQVVARSA